MKILKKILGIQEKLLRNPWKNGVYANHKCFCGSGKKLKKCHGESVTLTEKEMKDARALYEKWEDSPEGILFFKKLRGELC